MFGSEANGIYVVFVSRCVTKGGASSYLETNLSVNRQDGLLKPTLPRYIEFICERLLSAPDGGKGHLAIRWN